jgi:hypothetical protein
MTGLLRAALAALLVFVMSSISVAQDRAILYPGEGMALNGKQLVTSAAVFGGENIKTGTGQAQLVASGVTVQIEPDSSLQFGSPMVLGCGVVAVAGNSAVRVRDVIVTPGSATSKYHITNRGGAAIITVDAGSVRVSNGETETLASGQSATRPGDSCPGPLHAGPSVAAKNNGKLLGILGASAAAAIACGVLCRGDNGPVSPAKP